MRIKGQKAEQKNLKHLNFDPEKNMYNFDPEKAMYKVCAQGDVAAQPISIIKKRPHTLY